MSNDSTGRVAHVKEYVCCTCPDCDLCFGTGLVRTDNPLVLEVGRMIQLLILKKTGAMVPSKENARKALDLMNRHWWDSAPMGVEDGHDEAKQFILSFFEAAAKRLPTEEAINRDKTRKRSYHERCKASKATAS